MSSPRERACPNCSAPAEANQRWCLECGTELPGRRRYPGLKPAVGIATTLAVLTGAASAGGYTLLSHDKQPPPPAQTVAQAPPPATTPPATTPPTTQEPLPQTPSTPPLPTGGGHTGGSGGSTSTPVTPSTPPSDSSSSSSDSSSSSSDSSTSDSGSNDGDVTDKGGTTTTTKPPKPKLVPTDIALGAVVVGYAPYAPADTDLGDPSRIVDGARRTVWRTPAFPTPATDPQVGVYVDLASKEKLRKLVLRTPTPGMSVEIYGATSGPPQSITDPGWSHLATRHEIAAKTTIGLPSAPFRYVLVWITGLPPDATSAAISDLSLISMQPA